MLAWTKTVLRKCLKQSGATGAERVFSASFANSFPHQIQQEVCLILLGILRAVEQAARDHTADQVVDGEGCRTGRNRTDLTPLHSILQDRFKDLGLFVVKGLQAWVQLAWEAEDVGELGIVDLEEIAVRIEIMQSHLDEYAQPFSCRCWFRDLLFGPFIKRFNSLPERCKIDRPLGIKVQVDRALGHLGCVSDLLDGSLVKALSRKHPASGLQNF